MKELTSVEKSITIDIISLHGYDLSAFDTLTLFDWVRPDEAENQGKYVEYTALLEIVPNDFEIENHKDYHLTFLCHHFLDVKLNSYGKAFSKTSCIIYYS